MIKLPIKVSVFNEEEIERYEEMGLEVPDDSYDSYMLLNPNHIVAVVPIEDFLDIELTTGRRLNVYTTEEDFIKLLND